MIAVELTQADLARVEAINKEVPGYSGPHHYAFFKGVLEQYRHIKSILVLGVYHGRDMAYILDAAKRYHSDSDLHVYGVDKFEDSACADWPEDKKKLSWREAGFGEPPSEDLRVCKTLNRVVGDLPGKISFEVRRMDDSEFLEFMSQDKNGARFELIYLDTAHDYQTVARQLQQARRVCSGPNTIIAGDDYSDAGTWGVRSAVTNGFTSHEVFAEWIWISDASRLKP